MDRLVPPFFIVMALVWIISVYISSDIIIKIQEEEKQFQYLTTLNMKLQKILKMYNTTNNYHS